MKKIFVQILPWLLLLVVAILGYRLAGYFQTDSSLADLPKVIVSSECEFNTAGCAVMLNGDSYTISVTGDVTPLRPFNIQLQGDAINSAIVSFSMLDMDMGINRFSFQNVDDSSWKARVMLPVCTVSRKDWIADFTIRKENGNSFVVQYPFNSE